jgi:hypothetical protein
MTPDFVLGPALLEAVRQVVREELQGVALTVAAPTGPELLTPAEASERLGGRPSQKTIREWIHVGRLPKRTNNLGMDPKRRISSSRCKRCARRWSRAPMPRRPRALLRRSTWTRPARGRESSWRRLGAAEGEGGDAWPG